MTAVEPVRIFIGVDPGAKGACAVLACLDCPADDARHGRVVAHDVFDLPTCERVGLDGGGQDLDVAAFRQHLEHAVHIASDCMDLDYAKDIVSAVVEFPDVGGQMKGGRRQVIVQGLNAGMAFAALAGGCGWRTTWVASRSWRGEVASQVGCEYADAALVIAGAPRYDEALAGMRDRPDRCVAVLLADVLRRRWLGTAVVPRTKGAAKAAKSRKSAERKQGLARAVAPLTVAKARVQAVKDNANCDVHKIAGVSWTVSCTQHNRCCEARLLEWAWRQRQEPTFESIDLGAAAVELLPRIAAIYKRAVTSKRWSVAWHDSGEVGTMDPAEFDALEKYGLVQLVPGLRVVRYAPTERGLRWARTLAVRAEAKAAAEELRKTEATT